ncbi:glutamate-5-semialdehyde dehydrogenase [Saccharopolyspora sp. NPDC050389]|uniref:glutamate-5-semialdehyde dehydrogenase n=1 Tax=Saccharopolyspora sp. NPDC050389 TaxID=3155516 RepID=UPI0033E9377B
MTDELLRASRLAYATAPPVGDPAFLRYPDELARALTESWPMVLEANSRDVQAAQERGLPPVLVDRIRLGEAHLPQLRALTRSVAEELPEALKPGPATPVGRTASLRKVPKPLGVALMVYEARPTVTVEGALLPVVTGNAAILRGGKEIAATNAALSTVVDKALAAAGLPIGMVTTLDDPSRAVLRELLGRGDAIDVLIPRGSPSLIDYCRTASSIPVIASGGGVNHLYVHESADLALAAAAALDSKLAEPTACNTLELVLVDEPVAAQFVAALADAAEEEVTFKLDERIAAPASTGEVPWRIEPLAEHDFGREFLAPAIGVRVVDGLADAVEHIGRFGSMHTEGVVAGDERIADEFVKQVDAAAIVVNGSLRLHDGPTLGLGAEVSISTGRLHVRGPVTLRSLLTYTWLVAANGTLRSTVR